MQVRPLRVLLGRTPYGQSPEDETTTARWIALFALFVGLYVGGVFL